MPARRDLQIVATRRRYALRAPFRIARGVKTHAEAVHVRLTGDGVTGQAEATPYPRYGETLDATMAAIAALEPLNHAEDQIAAMPAGAARNALDCAFWDWRAKREGVSTWARAGVSAAPVSTAFTLSLDEPAAMARAAQSVAHFPMLKIKLGTAEDLPRLEAVRDAAPKAALLVDANEGWDAEVYSRMIPHLEQLQVHAIEQPLPAGADGALAELPRPIPIIADESCHTRADLAGLRSRYDMVNIKLDKTGGLTEALELVKAARAAGFGVMTGCMVGSSLAMAPALILARLSDIVDLDGPLLLAEDCAPALEINGVALSPAQPALWG